MNVGLLLVGSLAVLGLGYRFYGRFVARSIGIDANRPTPAVSAAAAALPVKGNTEEVGWLLYTSYLIPFEIASMLLLVAMIGAIVLAKREL